MRMLDKIEFNCRTYICIQKVLINKDIVYICQEEKDKKMILLKANDDGELQQMNDENIQKKVNDLIYAQSEDYQISNK